MTTCLQRQRVRTLTSPLYCSKISLSAVSNVFRSRSSFVNDALSSSEVAGCVCRGGEGKAGITMDACKHAHTHAHMHTYIHTPAHLHTYTQLHTTYTHMPTHATCLSPVVHQHTRNVIKILVVQEVETALTGFETMVTKEQCVCVAPADHNNTHTHAQIRNAYTYTQIHAKIVHNKHHKDRAHTRSHVQTKQHCG